MLYIHTMSSQQHNDRPVSRGMARRYGLVYPGIGWVIWRDSSCVHESLKFHVAYLGTDQISLQLNFSKNANMVAAQYYQVPSCFSPVALCVHSACRLDVPHCTVCEATGLLPSSASRILQASLLHGPSWSACGFAKQHAGEITGLLRRLH